MFKKTNLKQKNGFTLIELLVVTTIIIVLAAIGMVSYTSASRTSRDGKRKADIESVRQALVLYRTSNPNYPVTTSYDSMINTLVAEGFMSEPKPDDPKKNAIYYYRYTGAATEFCLCAYLEKLASGNSNNGSCQMNPGANFYCAKNP